MGSKHIIFCHGCSNVIRRSQVAKHTVDLGHQVAVGETIFKVVVTKRKGGYFAPHFSIYINGVRVLQRGTDGKKDGQSQAKREMKRLLYSNCPKCNGPVSHDQDGNPVHGLAADAASCGSIRVRWRD